MLKGISPLLSPELLAVLCAMGHSDEIVLADAHFPGETMGQHVIRADGLLIPDLLDAVLPLFELDSYVDHPAVMMAAEPGDTLDDSVIATYQSKLEKYAPGTPKIEHIGRFEFYDRAQQAFAVVMTGDTGKYGNILLKKGVTPVA